MTLIYTKVRSILFGVWRIDGKIFKRKVLELSGNNIDMSVINIFLGDCMKAMKNMEDKKYGLSIVDVPYGIDVNMNAGKRKGEKDRYENKNWDKSIPDWQYFEELQRISGDQILWGCNYFSKLLWSPGRISWFKNNGANNDFSDCELAMHTFNNRVTNVSIQWSGFIKPKTEKGNKRIHPTQKPIQLYKWLLKNYGFNKDGSKRTIFDSHGGSLSIVIACIEMGFDLDIWEIDKDYYDAGVKRVKNHISQLDAFIPVPEINFIIDKYTHHELEM